MRFKVGKVGWLCWCLASLWQIGRADAQSLILGIPNADVAHKGVLEITHESQIGIRSPVTWNSFNIFTTGITDRTELTFSLINLDNTILPGATFAAGAKHIIPLSDGPSEWRLTAGANIGFAPRLNYQPWGFFPYSHLSFRLPGWRTRLTGGVAYGTPHFFGFKNKRPTGQEYRSADGVYMASVMAGVEHPITKRLWIVADWFSGNQVQGALIAGFQYDWGPSALLLAYKLPNGSLSKNAIVTEIVVDIPYARKKTPTAH